MMQKINNKQVKSFVDDSLGVNTSYKSFGDSITAGSSASDTNHRYVNLIAAAKGWTLTNVGLGGRRMNDPAMIDAMYAEVVDNTKIYTLLSGVNDARTAGTDATLLDSFRGCLQAGVAWLSIPDEYKIKAANATKSGSWANGTALYGGLNYNSATNGSTISASIVGTTAYVDYIRAAGKTGTFTVSIDGTVVGSYSTDVTTPTRQNGDLSQYGAYLLRFPGLSYGEHTITVTVTSSTNSNNVVYIDWFGGNGFERNPQVNTVYVGNCLRASDAYYAANSPASDAAVALYNFAINDAVNSLAQDGLPICLVDVVSAQNRSTDLYTDGLHPNDTGHQKLANLFLNEMSSYVKVTDRGMTKARNTPWVSASLGSGWSVFDSGGSSGWGGPRFMKDVSGFVNLTGLAKNTSGSSNTPTTNGTIMTLPQGFRPKTRIRMSSVQNDTFTEFDIYPDGTVRLPTGISVSNGSWFSFSNCRFYADQ